MSTFRRIEFSEVSAALRLLPRRSLSSLSLVRAPRNPFALLGPAEDVLQGPRDGREVREQVAAAFQQLLDARRPAPAGSSPPISTSGSSAVPPFELDVLVAEQADRLDRRPRPSHQLARLDLALAQPGRGPPVHVVHDPDRPVGRVGREDDLDHVADRHAVQPHGVARHEARRGVESRLVRELLDEEVRPLPDHENADHDGEERDQDDEADAEALADLELAGHLGLAPLGREP